MEWTTFWFSGRSRSDPLKQLRAEAVFFLWAASFGRCVSAKFATLRPFPARWLFCRRIVEKSWGRDSFYGKQVFLGSRPDRGGAPDLFGRAGLVHSAGLTGDATSRCGGCGQVVKSDKLVKGKAMTDDQKNQPTNDAYSGDITRR